jgi:hypothetical protein
MYCYYFPQESYMSIVIIIPIFPSGELCEYNNYPIYYYDFLQESCMSIVIFTSMHYFSPEGS